MTDDRRPESATGPCQGSVGSEKSLLLADSHPQRLARQVIRSQASAMVYTERQLARAQQLMMEMQGKIDALRREKAIAAKASELARRDQAEAEQSRRIAETAYHNAKAAADRAQQDADERRLVIRDLRAKLAAAHQLCDELRHQVERANQEQCVALTKPAAALENQATPAAPPLARKRGRPPGSSNKTKVAQTPRQPALAEQEPVQW